MADMQPFYHIAAAILEPVLYAVLMLLVWFSFAASLSLRTNQAFWRVTIGRRLKAPIICSLLVLLSFFYPSLAYTILGKQYRSRASLELNCSVLYRTVDKYAFWGHKVLL